MITYLAPYICNLSEHTAPLRKLLQKDVEFQWHHEHDSAFTTLKEMIKNAGTLYFDVSKPVVIQVDASQEALGAALVQEGHIIAFTSKVSLKLKRDMQTSNVNCWHASLVQKDSIRKTVQNRV